MDGEFPKLSKSRGEIPLLFYFGAYIDTERNTTKENNMSAGNVIATKFEDIRTGEISWGVRIFDDYETYYSNIMEESEVKTADDLELLKLAKENYDQNSDGGDFFKSVAEMESGININGTYYDWDEISSVFDEGE